MSFLEYREKFQDFLVEVAGLALLVAFAAGCVGLAIYASRWAISLIG